MGIISRAQRYKKATKTEQELEKICIFLIMNSAYISADIQSIAFLTVASATSNTPKKAAAARRNRVYVMKKLYDAFSAVTYVFLALFGRKSHVSIVRSST